MHLFGSRIKVHKEEKIFHLFGRYDYHLQVGLPADELIPPSGLTLKANAAHYTSAAKA
jgi:hypothetical protein